MKRYYDNTWHDDANGTVGISAAAQKELGDIIYAELPEVGQQLSAGDVAVVVESTKAAVEIYSPVAGTVSAVNDMLIHHPELITSSPEDDGWLYRVTSRPNNSKI